MFGRKRSDAPQPAAPAREIVGKVDDRNIPFIDFQGHGFDLFRTINLGHTFWRATVGTELERLGRGQIVVIAAYTPQDLEASWPVMQRFMTIVLAMGLGPQYGARALTLGAVGYLDAERDEAHIQGGFGDAVARVRLRALRETPYGLAASSYS
ncbi:MAG: hypothetical protein QOH08_2260 [Chloroflexota bacterium]|jgi:hypothetical protein|nr:hypothetical protein [Chloroflexota bacterium]